MGCGASKDGVADPRPMQSHGRDNLQQVDTEITGEAAAVNPIDVSSDCLCSLYISSDVLNESPSSPSAFIHTPGCLSTSDEDEDDEDEDFDPNSFDIPSKLSIVEEDDHNSSQTTALAALSGDKSEADIVEVEERVEDILAADNEKSIVEQSGEGCALGMESTILQALLSTCPVITQRNLDADCSRTRVGHVAVGSGPEPVRWENTLRKAEIIDLDEEPDAGESALVVNTLELQQENQPDEEPAENDHELTKEHPGQDPKPDDAIDTQKTCYSGLELRNSKLPPLTIVPPILIELSARPAFPIIVLKKDLMEVKAPFLCDTKQFEDLSADDRSPPMGEPDLDSRIGDAMRSKADSPLIELEDGMPTPPSSKSPTDSERRSSLHRETPDPDLEIIDLSESPKVDSLPLVAMLDCHGIHTDNKDLISPSLRLCA